MIGRLVMTTLVLVVAVPAWARAEPINLKMLSNYSRATFKTDAPLETVVGNTAGPAVTGNLTVDPFKPGTASGTIKVDLTTLNTGVAKRDADMQGPQYLDIAANEAKVKGILTIKQKPVETVADARVTYIKLTPEQVEAQKRFGFASENIKVRSKLGTTFSNHGITIPQLMFLKLSNEIAIETDLTFAKQ
ncbi:MAG: hypothetical protein DME10_06680 [Candidatus Rokuibacteriota bacterium]|nr:MAG: hypothetical protein DME10_06680 [Candidatus Rokubacteria bacterium]